MTIATMKNSTLHRLATGMLMSLSLLTAFAQNTASTGAHETTAAEFTGYFKLIPVSNDHQPTRGVAKLPFQGVCQYFVHLENHDWVHVDFKNMGGDTETLARCNYTRSTLSAQMASTGRSAISWQKIDRGMATINREKDSVNLWKVDTFERPIDASSQLGVRIEKEI